MYPTDGFPSAALLGKISLCLKAEGEICAAFLHGSAVKGRLRETSDFDIALLLVSGQKFSVFARLELAANLECVLGRPVDLGILTTRNLGYAKEVASAGPLIFTRNQLASDRFIDQALSMYSDLQSSRREVLEAYELMPQTDDVNLLSGELPLVYRDPFDRLLAVQAIHTSIPVISLDKPISNLGAKRIW